MTRPVDHRDEPPLPPTYQSCGCRQPFDAPPKKPLVRPSPSWLRPPLQLAPSSGAPRRIAVPASAIAPLKPPRFLLLQPAAARDLACLASTGCRCWSLLPCTYHLSRPPSGFEPRRVASVLHGLKSALPSLRQRTAPGSCRTVTSTSTYLYRASLPCRVTDLD